MGVVSINAEISMNREKKRSSSINANSLLEFGVSFADAAKIERQVIFESTSLSSYYLHLSLFFSYIDY